MGELADRYAQAFLEAGGDGAELARCARQLEKEPILIIRSNKRIGFCVG